MNGPLTKEKPGINSILTNNMLEIGDKIVCVDDKPIEANKYCEFPNGFLKEGTIYLISGFDLSNVSGKLLIFVLGPKGFLKQDMLSWKRIKGEALGWSASRFRKIEHKHFSVTKKQESIA